MRRDKLARVGLDRARHQGFKAPTADEIVALHNLRARVVERLIDVALHAGQFAAKIIHARQVICAAIQVFKNEVGCRQGQLGLVDPALNIIAIVLGLASAFRDLIAGRLAHATQGLVLELALSVGGALYHLLHPGRAFELLGRAIELVQKAATARVLDHNAEHAKDKGHADRHDHDRDGRAGDR